MVGAWKSTSKLNAANALQTDMELLSNSAINEINDYVYVQGLAWAKEFIEYRKKWMEKQGIKATGALIASLEQEVTKQLQDQAKVKIEVAFRFYGRIIDMKTYKPASGGAEYIKALENWIEEKGFRERFTRTYMAKRKLTTPPPTIMNQLAWSIAISKANRFKRRRQWYNKPKQASISDLYNRVAAGLPEVVTDEIIKAFKS